MSATNRAPVEIKLSDVQLHSMLAAIRLGYAVAVRTHALETLVLSAADVDRLLLDSLA